MKSLIRITAVMIKEIFNINRGFYILKDNSNLQIECKFDCIPSLDHIKKKIAEIGGGRGSDLDGKSDFNQYRSLPSHRQKYPLLKIGSKISPTDQNL